MTLSSFFVIPGYTFFYWGFTLKKENYAEFISFFDLKEDNLFESITLEINRKKYNAKIRIARQNNQGKGKNRSDVQYPVRDVVQIFYDRERDTLKALRKLAIYSYATTIDTSTPKLKELLEFIHTGENNFKVKVISKQETEFDAMFNFLEDKNLFAFWQDENTNKKSSDKLFVDFSTKWLEKKDLINYKNRTNVIYLLHNSKENQIYVGKANIFGNRVKENSSRVAMETFDKFMYFEMHPDYSFMLDNLETFSIRFLASMFENYLNVDGLKLESMKLVNKQLKNK